MAKQPRAPMRRSSTIFCPSCQRHRPEGDMKVQTGPYEWQLLLECKQCQLAADLNDRAVNSARADRREQQ